MGDENKKEKIRNIVRRIGIGFLFSAAFLLIGISAYRFWEYKSGESVYDELEDNFTGTDHSKGKGKDPDKKDKEDPDDFAVDWDSLLAQNKDVIGWIRTMNGASYPILHGESDDTYLYHDINRSYNINGSIFLHYANSGKWYDKNSLIYGHNMNSGAMFGTNREYKDESFGKEHPYFYIYTPEGRYTYHIYAVIITEDQSACYNPDIQNDMEMKEYLDLIKKNALYTVTDAQPEDQVVTLSTCTGQAHGTTRLLIEGFMESFKPADGGKTLDRKELQFRMKEKRLEKKAEEYDEQFRKNSTGEEDT